MSRLRANIKVNGIVQGVGFRPFIHKQIKDMSLTGWIRNTSEGAEIEIEGEEETLDRFAAELWTKKPFLALIETVNVEKSTELKGYGDFRIVGSKAAASRNTLISPDVGICEDCLREMRDPKNRRYRYPFINCTNCGPRFTIIKDVPYDRAYTTMAGFKMCPDCYGEYTFIENRRYHAEPTCCPVCGPRLIYMDPDGNELPGDAIKNAAADIKAHRIVAVKGLGGIHLACLFDDEETPAMLRRRKQRDEKPFAIMCRDAETAARYCEISEDEKRVLESYRRPITLLRKKIRGSLRQISENDYVGVMLPYTPVHYLLMDEGLDALIMTSANLSDLPIIYRNEEALSELRGIADAFLLNDRDIHTRCDDSLLYVVDGLEYPLRRSRGYVPFPLTMKGADGMILACGAEQKASFSVSKGSYVFQSQHIGDLKNIETFDNYEKQIAHFERMFSIEPKALVCDLHPDYMSTGYAEERAASEGLPLIRVQHHWAHMASCMADNGLEGDCIGVVWDGTGYGTDGTVWGGEFLTGGYSGFERRGSLAPIRLPGGDRAVTEIWRVAASMLLDAGMDPEPFFGRERAELARRVLASGLNSPVCSSMGRLFDAAAALAGVREEASYEGQGAVLLETAAAEGVTDAYPYDISEGEIRRFEYGRMLEAMVSDLRAGAGKDAVCAKFMNTMVDMAAKMCELIREDTGLSRVVLSGGSFQNIYMLTRLQPLLREKGFEVFRHSRVSANDEGVSFGQLAIAAKGKSPLQGF